MADATGDGGQNNPSTGSAKQPLSYRAWKAAQAAQPRVAEAPPTPEGGPATVSTSGNTTTVDAPMSSSGTGETIQVGSKKANQPAEILSIEGEGAKKTGANQAEIGGDTDFEMDLPAAPTPTPEPEPVLSHEEQLAEDEAAKNDEGYQQYLKDFARDQEAANAAAKAAEQSAAEADNTEIPAEPANDIDRMRARSAAKKANIARPTSLQETPAENTEDNASEESSGETDAEAEEPDEEGEGADENQEPEAESVPETEPEKPVTPPPPKINKPVAPTQTQTTPPQLSFDEQAARANQLAANRARERTNPVQTASPNAATPATGETPKKSIKQRTADNLKKLNPVTKVKQGIQDSVNKAGQPLKSLKNLGQIRRLNQRAKENEKQQQELGKKIKGPARKIKRLQWLKRAYRSRQMIYGFLLFAYFATIIPLLLLVVGIGEGIIGFLVRGFVKARLRIKSINPEIAALQKIIAADQETILKLESERQEIAQAKVQLTQVFPTTKRTPTPQTADQNKSTQASQSTPWNAPADFNQNLLAANDNALPRQAANDNGLPRADEENEQMAA